MKNKILTTIFFLSGLVAGAQNYTWSRMPSVGQALYGPGSFAIDSNVYVTGGWKVSVIMHGGYPVPLQHQVWQFNTVTHTWTQKHDFPGTATYGTTGFAINGYGYLVNGWDSTGSGHGPDTTWQYNPATDSWTAMAPFPGSTRYTTGSFVLNGKAYIFCGFSPYVNDMWCFDPVANSWSQKAGFPGSARQAMVAFAIGNTGYAGMGATGDGMGSYFIESDWYKYDPAADTWAALNPFPGDAVEAASTFVLNGEAFLINGLDQSSVYYAGSVAPSNKVWKYNAGSDTWSLWGLFPDSALFSSAYASVGNAGYLGFGGENFSNYPLTSKFYRFGPGTAPYSCAISINSYEISNAVYNFQAIGNFSPSDQITWNFGDGQTGAGTSVVHNYTAVGSFTVTAVSTDSSASCSDSVYTTVSVANINHCSVSINETSFGQLFTLSTSVANGAGPYTYAWSCSSDSLFSSTSPDPVVTVPVNIPTTYCVTVTDTTGCVATACRTVVDSQTYFSPCQIYLIVYPDSAVPGYYNAVIYMLGGSGPLNFLWNFGDGYSSTQMYPSHTYATPGFYTVCLTVSDSSGSCSFTFCDSSFYAYKYGGGPMVHLNVRGREILGVNTITGESNISLHPNPAEKTFTIDAGGQQAENVRVSDLSGQTALELVHPAGNIIDIGNLAGGVYFVDVKIKGITARAKIVKIN